MLCTIALLPSSMHAALTISELQAIRSAQPEIEFEEVELATNQKENAFFLSVMSRLSASELGYELLQTAQHLGFQFGGFTRSASKANTDPATGVIRLREEQSVDISALSLAYELSNLINSARYRVIFSEASCGQIDAKGFVREVLKLEAEAILWRSMVADELGSGSLIVNSHYHRVATHKELTPTEKKAMILDHLRTSGRVGTNGTPVIDHYMKLYADHYGQSNES